MPVFVLHGDVNTTHDHSFAALLPALPAPVQARVGRLRRSVDRRRTLLGHALVAAGWRQLTGESIDWRLWAASAHGRPSLTGTIDFNVSHAGDVVVAALSTEGRVGIDVEPLRAVDLAGMDAYMNPEQWRTISASADAAAVFLDLWTVKESVVKCDGTGLSLPVREIDVQGDKAQLGEQMWHVRRLHVASGYACALASPLAIAQVALSHWQT